MARDDDTERDPAGLTVMDVVTTRDDRQHEPPEPPADAPPARAHARDGRRDLHRTVSAIVKVWDRRDLVEEMLTQQKPESAITRALMEDGLTKPQAHRYQAAVRLRWRKNGLLEGRDGRVARYRAGLERQVDLADREGDRKAAIAALGLLLKHEGDAPPPEQPAKPGEYLGEAQLVDRNDANEELRKRRATST